MEEYYLFGAGTNCQYYVEFMEKKPALAILDNNETLHGKPWSGLEIKGTNEYIEQGANLPILITAFFSAKEIAAGLKQRGITNYFIGPVMDTGFFANAEEVFSYYNITDSVEFYLRDPLSQFLAIKAEEAGISYGFYLDNNREDINGPIIISCVVSDEVVRALQKEFPQRRIIKLYEGKSEIFIRNDLKKFKDIHKGRRCFLIGNGPSLRMEDLEVLRSNNEISFGVNRVYLGYTETKWRPTYYCVSDRNIMLHSYDEIEALSGTKFFRHISLSGHQFHGSEIYEYDSLVCGADDIRLSYEIEKGIYQGHSVIYDALQIAVYMGFSEIYLLGVDLSDGINYQSDGAHFYKSPNSKESLGGGDIKRTRRCFGEAQKLLEKRGVKLSNATRGAVWTNVSLVDFDQLFK